MKRMLDEYCSLGGDARIVIVTDAHQAPLAKALRAGREDRCEIIEYEKGGFMDRLRALSPADLAVAALSFETFMDGARDYFSPFSKPEGVAAKYAFIRLSIAEKSLAEGLSTPRDLVSRKIAEMDAHKPGARLHITNAAGTDMRLVVKGFNFAPWEISEDGGMAFLPPSETSADVEAGSAQGVIAVDVTVGQLYYFADMLDYFGLVPETVYITVKGGVVTDITGGEFGARLKEKMFALPEKCRELVELGQGLSMMAPTGLIGVDESIIDTCHFGIGDGACGVHHDVVIKAPRIAASGLSVFYGQI